MKITVKAQMTFSSLMFSGQTQKEKQIINVK